MVLSLSLFIISRNINDIYKGTSLFMIEIILDHDHLKIIIIDTQVVIIIGGAFITVEKVIFYAFKRHFLDN